MKTAILLSAIIFISFNINAQKINSSDVPLEVRTAFTAMYPNESNVKWELENGKYEAEFKATGVVTSVLFLPSGSYLQTETEIPVSSLPPGVNSYAAKNFPGKTISEATRIIDANGTISYEAEIGKSDYLFDTDGAYISKSTDLNDDK